MADQWTIFSLKWRVLNLKKTIYGTSPRGSWLTEKGFKLLNPLFTEGPLKYVEEWG